MLLATFTGNDEAAAGSGHAKTSAAITGLRKTWLRQSLAFQFFVVGGLVSACAMILVGLAVSVLIERAVTRNAAATTAMYVDSVIAPLLPDMRTNTVLDEGVKRALDETLGQGALGSRLAAMRLWGRDGTILYADDSDLIGRRIERSEHLQQAFTGSMVVNYGRFDVLSEDSGVPEGPLLEIYNPILQPWSGDVVAVIEFYEFAHDFEATLQSAVLRSWLAVAAVILVFFLILYAIVLRGSRTIDRQARDLGSRVAELTALLEQNRALHRRVQSASQRVTALNEGHLRRIGADLHDGPAQLVALASLRLDSETVLGAEAPRAAREDEISSIRGSLEEALREIRSICHGLVLPHIENATVPEVVNRAIEAYERRTGMAVERHLTPAAPVLPVPERICIYRFLQEALNNGYRHCRGARQIVSMTANQEVFCLAVSDCGPGFDPAAVSAGSLGLAGLRERVESLGGRFELDTSQKGTKVAMTIDVKEAAPAS